MASQRSLHSQSVRNRQARNICELLVQHSLFSKAPLAKPRLFLLIAIGQASIVFGLSLVRNQPAQGPGVRPRM